MNVLVLYTALSVDATLDDLDGLNQMNAVVDALLQNGHRVYLDHVLKFSAYDPAKRVHKHIHAVFNLVEKVSGDSQSEYTIPLLLEANGTPFTGSGADALRTSNDKVLAKELMESVSLPTPRWYWEKKAEFIPGTYIIKAVDDHGSFGLDQGAVVVPALAGEADGEIRRHRRIFGGRWFAEEYIHGREFNVSYLETDRGPAILPPAEILFSDRESGPRIVDYAAKWDVTSSGYAATPRTFDFPAEDAGLLETIRRLTLLCCKAFNIRGYARVDFRVDEHGLPYIIDVNANPCISPDSGFSAAASRHGLGYAQLIETILQAGMRKAARSMQMNAPAVGGGL